MKNNFHFSKKWENYFKYENYDKIALNILKKIIKNKKAIDAKTCLFSKNIYEEMSKYIKIKRIEFPLTKRRVELEMRNAGLMSKVFTFKGNRFRGWIKR